MHFECERDEGVFRSLGSSVVMPLAAGAKDLRFNSTVTQHVQRLFSWTFMYGVIGSLILSWSWTRQPGILFLSIEMVLGPTT